jgi:hypothetical protein
MIPFGLQKVIGVFHPFGNSLAGQEPPEIIAGEKNLKIINIYFGVNGH